MPGWYQWQGDTLLIDIRIQPRASCDEIVGPQESRHLKVRITAPPVDGKANRHLIKFLAKAFGVAKGQVLIIKGLKGREKRLAITAPGRFPEAAQIGKEASQ